MRVLMTTDAVGGVWDYSLELASSLSARDIDITLAITGRAPSQKQMEALHRIPELRIRHFDTKHEWELNCQCEVISSGEWLMNLAEELRPDLAHLHSYFFAGLEWNCPRVLVCHSSVCSWFDQVKNAPLPQEYDDYSAWVKTGLVAADAVVFPSASIMVIMQRIHGNFGRSEVILNGRDPGIFKSAAKEPFIFGAGRLWDEAKNMASLRSVPASLTWPIRIAGDCESTIGLNQPGELQFTGFLSQKEMADYYSRASIFVSTAKYEPFGLAVLEAAMSGCALALSDIPTFRELWEDAAVFVNADDSSALARTLLELIDDPERISEMMRNAKTRAARYNSMKMAETYLDLYQDLIHSHAGFQRRRQSVSQHSP